MNALDSNVESLGYNVRLSEAAASQLVSDLVLADEKRLSACARTKLEEARMYMQELVALRRQRATQAEKDANHE